MTYPAQPPEPPPLVHFSSTQKVFPPAAVSESSWVPQKSTVAAKYDESSHYPDVRETDAPYESGNLDFPVVSEASLPVPELEPLLPSNPTWTAKVPIAATPEAIEPWEAPSETVEYAQEASTYSSDRYDWEVEESSLEPIGNVGDLSVFSANSAELDLSTLETSAPVSPRDDTVRVDRPERDFEVEERSIEPIGNVGDLRNFSTSSRQLNDTISPIIHRDYTFSVDRTVAEVPTPVEPVGEMPGRVPENRETIHSISRTNPEDFAVRFDRPASFPEIAQTPTEPIQPSGNLPSFFSESRQLTESSERVSTPRDDIRVDATAIQQRGDLPNFSTNSALLNPPSSPRTGDFSFSLDRILSPLAQTPSNTPFSPILADPAADPFKRPIQPSPPGGLQDLFGLPEPIEVTADRQEFDERRDIFTAYGNVVMRYQGAIVDADWLEVNLRSRLAIGEGNVALTQPERVIRGDRFRYNLIQETGTIFQARGELSSVTPNPDDPASAPPSGAIDPNGTRLLSDRILANQPLEVIPTGGGFQGSIGAGRGSNASGFTGTISRFRFEADRIDFYPGGWQGSEVRITNDPFGPEFELRANTATFTRLSALQDEILLDDPRLVFDDAFALPLFRERFVIDRRPRDPTPIQIGFDGRDRGGLFLFRDFEVLQTQNTSFTLTPQYYIQRGFDRRNLLSLDELGIVARLNSTLSPDTTFTGIASFTNLNPDTFDPDGDDPNDEDDGDLRASARLAQKIGTHTLTTEYSYRDRLFNGSLGFRTIHQTAGIVLTSPNFAIGTTGINLRYQGGVNWIEANTDRLDLLNLVPGQEIMPEDRRASMVRFQGIAEASKGLLLWVGEGLPATPDEGLRYTPVPVVPYIQLFFNARGIAGLYTRSDPNHNLSLRGTVGLQGQFGHFSDSFLDYTGFNISYSETISDGESPFFFDREVDRRRLSLGITQQIVGPLRASIQTSINLRTGEAFSTDYILEYSRRSYGVIVRFNPDRELGSLSLRISDFNWRGNTAPFFETEDF